MKVTKSGGTIKVSRPKILLLVDGALATSGPGLLTYVVAQARKHTNLPRLMLLSRPELHDGLPAYDEIAKFEPARRGRFLTPAIEAGTLGSESKSGSLICVTGGPIHDWRDWHECLSSNFERIIVFTLSDSPDSYQGADVVSLVGLSLREMEEAIAHNAFSSSIEAITLSSREGLIYGLPRDFSANPMADGEVDFTLQPPEGDVAIDLFTVGGGDSTQVQVSVELTGQSEPEVFWFDNENQEPQPLASGSLCKESLKAFSLGIGAYLEGTGTHYCSLCNEVHDFSNAFMCTKQMTVRHWERLTGRRILRELLEEPFGSWAALVASKDDVQTYALAGAAELVGECVVLTSAQGVFVMRLGNGRSGGKGPAVEVLEEVYSGLFVDREHDLYVLSLGGRN